MIFLDCCFVSRKNRNETDLHLWNWNWEGNGLSGVICGLSESLRCPGVFDRRDGMKFYEDEVRIYIYYTISPWTILI
jgi:hypothetical protein